MADIPNFTDPQFIDSNGPGGLNAAFGAVSATMAMIGGGTIPSPGLICPEAMQVNFNPSTGVSGIVTLNAPWALMTPFGVIIQAHGTQTGSDTQAYPVNLHALLPTGAYTSTAYVCVSGISIQQNAVPIAGPPPGHPSWNPFFVPTIGYATNVDSVAVFGTLTPPDNVTTFGLFSTVLRQSQAGLTVWNPGVQQRAGVYKSWPSSSVANGLLTPQQAQNLLTPAASSQTNTLPSSTLCAGLLFKLLNSTFSTWTISASGSDVITTSGGGVTSLNVPAFGACELWTSGSGVWDLLNVNTQSMLLGNLTAGTGISIINGVISTNLTGASGIQVSGSVISTLFSGASGVSVSGNTISSLFSGASGIALSSNIISANNVPPQTIYGGHGVPVSGASGPLVAVASGTFVAPYNGRVTATGSFVLNDTLALASGQIQATLLINGTGVVNDTVTSNSTHTGSVYVLSGTTVTVAYQVSGQTSVGGTGNGFKTIGGAGADISFMVSYGFTACSS